MKDDTRSREGARLAGAKLLADHAADDPFAAAFKQTRMPMIITDPGQNDNPIIFSNAAFCRLTGYSAEELLGRNCRLLQGPETDPGAVASLRQAVQSRRSISVDLLNYRKDGSTFWNALYISPAFDSNGRLKYFFASQLDFTAIKNKEEELAAARGSAEAEVKRRNEELERALSAKTMLIHEVDHRVKNNLMTVASLLKLKMRMSDETAGREAILSVLERIEALSAVQRTLFTCDDVAAFDAAAFARDLLVDMAGACGRDDIRLDLDLSPVMVPAHQASPFSLVVNELVSDAMRRGLRDRGGTIRVSVKQIGEDLVVQVSDMVEPALVEPEEDAFSRTVMNASLQQLGARLVKDRSDGRTTVRIELSIGKGS